MKLYYTKGTCSFGPHIAMRELGIEPELIAVNLMEKKLPEGGDFKGHNPKGYVPYIETDDGTSVRSNVVNCDPDPERVKLGMKVKLTTYSIGTDDEGTEAIAFGYEPA